MNSVVLKLRIFIKHLLTNDCNYFLKEQFPQKFKYDLDLLIHMLFWTHIKDLSYV